ncbi:MAG: hypothetical protein FJ290_12230 [Planctomycetes bacterium]|nr:hypothetical protein [Planctomycetota bacterium]
MSRLEFPYDPRYRPPAPVVEILVRGLDGGEARCKALVDSSAGLSCVPRSVLDSVGSNPHDTLLQVAPLFGEPRAFMVHYVEIRLGSKQMALKVLAYDRDVALLGRDFLNECTVVLDGRAQKVSVED